MDVDVTAAAGVVRSTSEEPPLDSLEVSGVSRSGTQADAAMEADAAEEGQQADKEAAPDRAGEEEPMEVAAEDSSQGAKEEGKRTKKKSA